MRERCDRQEGRGGDRCSRVGGLEGELRMEGGDTWASCLECKGEDTYELAKCRG